MNDTWYMVKEDIEVTYLWWYDTIAILPEYDDTENGLLPKGEKVRISEDKGCEPNILLDLENHKNLKKSQLPKKRIQETLLLCKATPLQAIITKQQFEEKLERI